MTNKEEHCIIGWGYHAGTHSSTPHFHGAMAPIVESCPTIAAQLSSTKEYTQVRSTPKIVIEVQHPKIACNVLQDLVVCCDNQFTEPPSAERYDSGPQMWFHLQMARAMGITVMAEVYESVIKRIKAKAQDLKRDKEEYEMLEGDRTIEEPSMLNDNDDWELVEG